MNLLATQWAAVKNRMRADIDRGVKLFIRCLTPLEVAS